MIKVYQIRYTHSARDDMRSIKRYILQKFHYRELGENFTRKMKKAAKELTRLPERYVNTGFSYRGYEIHMKTSQSYLLFFVVNSQKATVTVLRVMQDGMNWKYVLKRWLQENQ